MFKRCFTTLVQASRYACCGLIRAYQYCISPCLGATCRFQPTCSAYTLDAIRVHGVVRGIVLGSRRLLRCQPFCRGGHDPLPPSTPSQTRCKQHG